MGKRIQNVLKIKDKYKNYHCKMYDAHVIENFKHIYYILRSENFMEYFKNRKRELIALLTQLTFLTKKQIQNKEI